MSAQAEALGVKTSSRISPHLELCCLRLSGVLSYEKAQEEIAVQTGRRVSQKTHQRLVHRQSFGELEIEEAVTQLSLDGGMIRLSTPKGETCEWREYKALNLTQLQQGMAWFKDNDALLAWTNDLPLAELVDCLGDGHDGVWRLYEHVGQNWQRHEVLDWFHLIENLYKLPESEARLATMEGLLWQGKLDETLAALKDCESDESRRFQGYLQRHRGRIPNYAYYQAEGLPIGSGDIESFIKQISARVKISGAAWNAEHVPQVLAHRCAYLNGQLEPEAYFSS